jgi:membrane protease YdiL (CAAX protease family)
MKKAVAFAISLTALTALSDGVALLFGAQLDPWRLAALFGALALTLCVFAGFTDAGFARQLRHWAARSAWTAFGIPLLLLVPYLVFALGTGTFSLGAAARLAAYIALPTALLLPDRLRPANRIGWRDFAAMAALGVPVAGHWLEGIWAWPEEIYFFRPLYSVCVGAYAFMVIRNLEGAGYRLGFRKGDVIDGLTNFVAFGVLGIPLGMMLRFIHPHADRVSPVDFAIQLFGIYITIAIPEEFLFRGILQNFLVRSIAHRRRALYGVLIASAIFGASHLHHPPVPNWKYAILATLAGIFYGNAFRTRQRLSASALTHTLVDTLWHFWF